MRWLVLTLTLLATGPSFAAHSTIRDGGTIDVGGITYRLGGVDAPAADQLCIDDHADSWACGAEAREQLTKLIGDRDVHCDDQGPDAIYKKWHVGICTVQGEAASLNQLLVRSGFALNAASTGTDRFGADEAEAKKDRRGLWKGCFLSPHEFRAGQKDGALLGGACRSDKDREIRQALFPQDLSMPSGCGIKGKYALRARVTGNLGIYHLRACSSYPALTRPDRWFCSEDDAKAAGFRKAYNCRPFTRQRS